MRVCAVNIDLGFAAILDTQIEVCDAISLRCGEWCRFISLLRRIRNARLRIDIT